MKTRYPLELTEREMRHMVAAAMDRIVPMIASLPGQPVDTSADADPQLVRSMVEPLPEAGTDFQSLLGLIFDRALPDSLNALSPGFMGYVPGGGLFHAGIADLIADALNRYVGAAIVAPALTQIEANVVRWLCEILGFPDQSRGFLTSGGSLANLSALITARTVMLGETFSDATIYVSDQVHHCVSKAARLAGFPHRSLRVLQSDGHWRLDPGQVADAIATDRADGLTPFLIAASAGTTNTGAVDPLDQLGQLAREQGLWFHVDAAYGGLFRLTDRGKVKLAGIEGADSVVLDPHKTLFLPYGTGALLVRNGDHLRATHHSSADYMPTMDEDDHTVNFCDLSPELTRPFRGLRVWLPLKMHGAGVFRHCLDEKLDLARDIEARIRTVAQLEILAGAELSILAFAVRADGGENGSQRNTRTRRLMALVNARQRVNLTGTMLGNVFAIRIAVVAFRTHQDRLDMLFEDLTASLRQLTNEFGGPPHPAS